MWRAVDSVVAKKLTMDPLNHPHIAPPPTAASNLEQSCLPSIRACLQRAAASIGLVLLLAGFVRAQDTLTPPVVGQHAQAPEGDAYHRFGGDHEFGILAGYSPVSGPVWGYDQNVRYAPIVLRYSFLIDQWKNFSLRYAPEITALAVLHENGPSETNPAAPTTALGAGFSMEGFQIVFRPTRMAQPFLSNAGGFTYYNQRVLSPEGSQWMYTIDFGAGVNVFFHNRDAVTFGFRYQHLSNANISIHNPGTDADTFYIGLSHFHTHGLR